MRRKYEPVRFEVKMGDVSALPMQHVNALDVQASLDEFFLTFALVIPPGLDELDEIPEPGHLVGQPIVRLAVTRATMDKMICILQGRYEQQTEAINDLEEFRNWRPPKEEQEDEDSIHSDANP